MATRVKRHTIVSIETEIRIRKEHGTFFVGIPVCSCGWTDESPSSTEADAMKGARNHLDTHVWMANGGGDAVAAALTKALGR